MVKRFTVFACAAAALLLIPIAGLGQDSLKKESFILPVPVVCSNPTAGFIFGVGLAYSFRPTAAHYVSVVSSSATYSTNRVMNLSLKSNIFAEEDRWLINTDWRLQDNTETTYGLGSGKETDADLVWLGLSTKRNSRGQTLDDQQIRMHEVVSRRVADHLFAGMGFRFDRYQHIADNKTRAGDSLDSDQYRYSVSHGFNPTRYTVSGVCLNLLYDSRDNEINAYNGSYLNLNYQVNTTALGSSRNSQSLLLDLRSYYQLSPSSPHVLAFWLYGNFLTSGELPYLALPALGYDQRSRSGRGYAFGRFRGEDLLYEETEYRFPLPGARGRLGGVLFLNLTSTSDRDHNVKLGDYIEPGYGAGLRVNIDRQMRTRLQADLGLGRHSAGFYFGFQETF